MIKTNRHLHILISVNKKTLTRANTISIKDKIPFMQKVVLLPRIILDSIKNKVDTTSWSKCHYHRGSNHFNLTLKTFADNFEKVVLNK